VIPHLNYQTAADTVVWYSALTIRRRLIQLSDTLSIPQVKYLHSCHNTIGTVIMVHRRPAPPIPIPTLAVTRAVSTPSVALTSRFYFLYRAARFYAHPHAVVWEGWFVIAGRSDPVVLAIPLLERWDILEYTVFDLFFFFSEKGYPWCLYVNLSIYNWVDFGHISW